MGAPVVVLAGGTGGAKLARGLLDVAGSDLVVIANTGDDVAAHGGHISPDPDLVTFWLADRIDARGWGLAGDTFAAMDARRAAGDDVWFELGDEDLALCRRRGERLAAGERLTEITADVAREYGVEAQVLPMCDEPVRTRVDGVPFQEWMIRRGGRSGGEAVGRIELDGIDAARLTPEVAEALTGAQAILIGPSNPVISIGPILAVRGLREALAASAAAVVAVSPFVRGEILKGPTSECMRAAGVEPTVAGLVSLYALVIDGLVADERADGVPVLVTDVLMADAAARRRVAEEALGFAEGLRA